MKVTKNYCDFCGDEMRGEWFALTSKLQFQHEQRDIAAGYKHRDFAGDFCSIKCAGGFVASDGKKEPPKPIPSEEFNSLQQVSCHPNHAEK